MQKPSRRSAVLLFSTLTAVSALLAGCGTLGSRPPRSTDLSGEWKLDESLSDDPQAMIHQQRQNGGQGHMGGYGGGGYGGGGYGGGGNSGLGMPGSGGYGG